MAVGAPGPGTLRPGAQRGVGWQLETQTAWRVVAEGGVDVAGYVARFQDGAAAVEEVVRVRVWGMGFEMDCLCHE